MTIFRCEVYWWEYGMYQDCFEDLYRFELDLQAVAQVVLHMPLILWSCSEDYPKQHQIPQWSPSPTLSLVLLSTAPPLFVCSFLEAQRQVLKLYKVNLQNYLAWGPHGCPRHASDTNTVPTWVAFTNVEPVQGFTEVLYYRSCHCTPLQHVGALVCCPSKCSPNKALDAVF